MTGRQFEIKLSWIYLGIWVVAALLTCGVGGVLFWWWIRSRVPMLIDEEGITIRDGRRFLWKDLTKCDQIDVVDSKTRDRISGALDLHFGDQVVKLDSLAIDDPVATIDVVRSVLEQRRRRGPAGN